ncbi:MAG: hypothetical protein ABIR36_02455 [Nitrospiraceae bacterium]
MVRDVAAKNCVRLSIDCLAHARKHIAEKTPEVRSRAEDQLFSMKSGQFQKMANTEGFWWYYIAQLAAGNRDFATTAIAYQRDYFSKGKTFERADKEAGDT